MADSAAVSRARVTVIITQLGNECKVIVVHGAEDLTCPIEHAREMVNNMKSAGLEVDAHFLTNQHLDGTVFTSAGHALGNRTLIVFKVADQYILPDSPTARVRKRACDFDRRDTKIRFATPNGAFVISYEAGYPVGRFEPKRR